MFKKFIAVSTASALTVAMAVTAFAAGSINASEQKILDELAAKGVPASQIEKVKAEFVKDGVEVTESEATTAISKIDEAKEIVEKNGITTVEELKANTEVLNQVTALANEAAKAVKYTGTITVEAKGNGTIAVAATNKDTKAGTTSSTIKTTGVDFSTTAAVVAGLGLSVAGVAVASRKKDFVNA